MFNMDRQNTDTPNTSTMNSQSNHIMEQISTCTLVTVCSLLISFENKKKQVSMSQEIPQSHATDHPMAP